MSTLLRNLKIFWALNLRELKVIRSFLKKYVIDSIVYTAVIYIVLIKLFPQLGLKQYSVSLFIGNISILMLFSGFARLIQIKHTLRYSTFMDYYWSLPLSRRWLLAQQVTSFFLHIFITTSLAIAALLTISKGVASWPKFLAIYTSSLMFISILFAFLSYAFSERWLWDRLLNPMLTFGGAFFSWRLLSTNSPTAAKLVLLDPLLYIAEGLRTTILGNAHGLPFSLCFSVLILLSIVIIPLLIKAIKKELDPVW